MKRIVLAVAVVALVAAGIGIASAQDPFVYPAKGQSESKMAKDKSDCHAWAIKETGIDPSAPPPAQAAPQGSQGPKGERLRGGARGAAGGAAVGAIAGDAGKGAAIGAVGAGMRAGRQAREEKKEEKVEAQQQAQAAQQQRLASFNRAFAACMEGRGYSVK